MTKSYSILIFVITVQTTFCQPYLQWATSYSGGQYSQDRGHAIIVDNKLNVYVTGQSRRFNDNYNYITIKYNSSGDTLWSRRYNKCYPLWGCDNSAHTIVLDSANNVYVGGGRSLIKYNNDGNTLWIKDSIRIVKLKIYDNQCIYAAGIGYILSNNSYTHILYKIDLNGNIIWYKTYSLGTQTTPNDMEIDQQGNIIITGESDTQPPNSNNDYYTIKYNQNGDVLWLKRYDSGYQEDDFGYGVAVDNSNNVYVTGRSRVNGVSGYLTIKYSPTGDSLWTQRYLSSGSFGTDIAIDGQGNVLVTGNSCNSYCYTTLKYTSNGNFLWSKTYQQSTSFVPYFNSIVLDENDDIYVNVAGAVPPDTSAIRIIKYDSSGSTIGIAYHYGGSGETSDAITLDRNNNLYATGIMNQKLITVKFSQNLTLVEPSSSEIPSKFQLYQNFPNPFNPVTNIKYDLPEDANVTIKIFDLLGREIFNINKPFQKAGSYETEWNAEDFSSGVYFLRINAGIHTSDIKLVVLK